MNAMLHGVLNVRGENQRFLGNAYTVTAFLHLKQMIRKIWVSMKNMFAKAVRSNVDNAGIQKANTMSMNMVQNIVGSLFLVANVTVLSLLRGRGTDDLQKMRASQCSSPIH